ncbi:MAG TPA: hypothetical protein VNN21_07285 [Dehalococcoidia bacterium]|nr:hypothetical protein [Dehalococcoidia bacterium]
MTLITLDPTGVKQVELNALAPRLQSLNGATVGILHNVKKNARELLVEMANVLQDRYEIEILGPELTAHSMLASEEQLDRFAKECDVVLTGLGD